MPKVLTDCRDQVYAQMKSRGMSDDDASNAAHAICVKSTGFKFTKHTFDELDLLYEKVGEFAAGNNRYVYIAGTALVEGTSRNHVRYTADEIKKAAPTMVGAKFNANHDKTKPPIGRVIAAPLIESKQLNFVVEVDTQVDPATAASLESGYIDHVSIEAQPEWVECSLCGKNFQTECRDHYPGQVGVNTRTKKEETCELIPHNFTFGGLAAVYDREGVPAAQIANTAEPVLTFIEKMSQKEMSGVTMSEKDMQKMMQDMLEKAKQEWEENQKVSQENKVLKDVKSDLEKRVEESRNREAQLEKQIKVRLARDVATLESRLTPSEHPTEKLPDRVKELAEWDTTKLEMQMEILEGLAKENPPKSPELEEQAAEHKGGFVREPPAFAPKPVQVSEDVKKTIKDLEHKRAIEKSLGFEKPLKEEFVDYCIENELVFKQDPKAKPE